MAKHSHSPVLFICSNCKFEEFIPQDVLEFFDVVDPDIHGAPPTFQCQLCVGIMFPDDFKEL